MHLGEGWVLHYSQESSNTFAWLPFNDILSELMWNKWLWIMSEEKNFGASQKMLSPSRSTSSCSSKQGSRQVIQPNWTHWQDWLLLLLLNIGEFLEFYFPIACFIWSLLWFLYSVFVVLVFLNFHSSILLLVKCTEPVLQILLVK